MVQYFQKKYALSAEGARDLIKAIFWSVLLDISFMLPVIASLIFVENILAKIMGASGPEEKGLPFYLILSGIFFAVMCVIARFQYNAAYTKIYDESSKRRIQLAETLRRLPLAFFARKDVSDLSATIMEDATQIETLFSHSVAQLYSSIITVVIAALLLFPYQWKLAAALFWVVPVALLVFVLSRKVQKKMHQTMYGVKRDLTDRIQEQLESAQEIKAYNQEKRMEKDLAGALDAYEEKLIRDELLLGALVNLSYLFLKLGLPSVMLAGAFLAAEGAVATFPFLVFLVLAARIYDPIMGVMNNFAVLLYMSVRIERMKEMDAMPRQEGKKEFAPEHYDIAFENVDFSYQEGISVLRGVSFTARQGQVTALAGPSGSGKTTAAKLAARFWDIDRGKITLGGEDISQIDPETLLKHYSIVFQDVTLFNATVRENIRLGRKDASDEEVLEAARLAQCDDFVRRLPEGYDTRIGENGEKLSGGERQRISIARAILKDAPIILLDEATASLDTENETKIQRALSELIRNKTVIMIAHRMRTILNADQIVVIEDGSVSELGTPEELTAKGGTFDRMRRRQLEESA